MQRAMFSIFFIVCLICSSTKWVTWHQGSHVFSILLSAVLIRSCQKSKSPENPKIWIVSPHTVTLQFYFITTFLFPQAQKIIRGGSELFETCSLKRVSDWTDPSGGLLSSQTRPNQWDVQWNADSKPHWESVWMPQAEEGCECRREITWREGCKDSHKHERWINEPWQEL